MTVIVGVGVGVKSIQIYLNSITKHSDVCVIVGVKVIVGVGVSSEVKEGVGVNKEVTDGVIVGVGVTFSQYR